MPIKNSQETQFQMSQYTLDFEKLLIYDPNKSRSTCHLFVSNQSPIEEKNLGKLFIIAEITSNDRINLDIINTIQEEIKNSYYNTDDLQIETALEKALENANQRIADMVGDYDTNWLDKLNIAVAVIKDKELYFAHIGRLYVFLARNNKITNIIESTENADTLTQPINPLKAFSNIISGDLEDGDNLFFCTASLLDYLSVEKIKRTIEDNQPEGAMQHLENVLSENSVNMSCGAITIRLQLVPQTTGQPQLDAYNQSVVDEVSAQSTMVQPQYSSSQEHYTDSNASMEKLLEKKDKANQVLTPSMGRYFKELLSKSFSAISEFFRLKILKQSPRRLRFEKETRDYRPAQTTKTETQPSYKKKQDGQTVKKIFSTIGGLLTAIFRGLAAIFKKSDKVAKQVVSSPKTFSQKIASIINKFIKLRFISKILLVSAIVVAFFLAQNVFTSVMNQQSQEQNVEFDQTIAQVSQNILKAEAALSYDNEDGAKELLVEAKNVLDGLPQKEEEQKQKINELLTNIDDILAKTRRIANMATLNIADFSSINEAVNIDSIIKIDNNIYGLDRGKKIIYEADIDTGEINSYELDELENTFQYGAPYGNNIILFNSANGFDEFDTAAGTADNLSFSLPIDDANITNINTYENRVYLLDINNNQIFRSSRITGGYSQAIKWLEDDTSLSNAIDIAIDGNVYILNSNGAAYRLFQGVKQTWDLSIIDPPLNSADKLATNIGIENLFVLDSNGKRIIEFTKEGKLVNQYVSDNFSDLKDFTVDWDARTTYVLNGNQVVSIDILP